MGPRSPLRWLLPALAPASYLLACAILGALLAYPLALALDGRVPLPVLVGRLTQGMLLIGMVAVLRRPPLRAVDLGFPSRPGRLLRQLLVGFGLGVAMLGLHVLVLVALDIRTVDLARLAAPARLWEGLWKALATGLAVAFLEEPLFRGLLLGGLVRATPRAFAVVVCSLYFAALHFLKTDLQPAFAELRWYSGVPLVLDAFRQWPARIQPDTFLALLSAGILLALVRLRRPGNLGYCIGLHAGWVFVIKATRAFTRANPEESLIVLVGHYDGVIGYLAAAWMALIIIVLVAVGRYVLPRPG
ncbi:CPBP family intramembrane glutamic endopeptidase [Candidatus Methylocalor cossyra]|uniref:CAAX prenyl protease 2/Lysostaphin resistance protein A-like domain-containing protein n=1 Tax=Candidatus Methylocalor cossyra TaxID=3108543 RepID=A0ABP1C7T9_9GAMM